MSDASVGAIKVLVGAFDDIVAAGRLVVPAEKEQLVTAVFGWWSWINRSCKLVLLAHEAGLAHESIPGTRSIVEHSLVLQWVVDVGADALATVDAVDEERRRKLYDELVAVGSPVPDDVTRPERTTHPLQAYVSNFARLCAAYGAKDLYLRYRMMSTHIHPTAKGAEAYVLDGRPGGQPVVDLFEVFIEVTAVCVAQAALAINSLLSDEALSGAINDAQELLGVTIERPTLR
ncbi:DUF5677 domain-containing protein [Lentzea sp. HUAS TT2]|uniref:DUF5677 domain-containing protein n=1 Tax=Lentzea sp. HUAS TT2 TaxID=3447454 RepID=UPI003F719DB9